MVWVGSGKGLMVGQQQHGPHGGSEREREREFGFLFLFFYGSDGGL